MSIETDKKGVNSPLDNSNPQQGTFPFPSVHNEKRLNRKDSKDAEMNISKSTTEDGEQPLTRKTSMDSIQHVKVPPTKKDSRKLFVGGLPSNVTNEEFRIFFEGYGTVIDSVVMIDRDTRRSRGFGFVTFEKLETAEALLKSGNKGKKVPPEGFKSGKLVMRGKTCEVKISEPKEVTCTPQGQKKVSRRNGQDLITNELRGNFTNDKNEQSFRAVNLPPHHDGNQLPPKPFDPTPDHRYSMGDPGLISRNNMIEPHYLPQGIHHSHMYYPNLYMGVVPMPHTYEHHHIYPANDMNYPHNSTRLNPPMDGYGYIPYPEPYPFIDLHHFPPEHNQYYAGHYNYIPNPNSGTNQENHTESSSQEESITANLESLTLNEMPNGSHTQTLFRRL